MMQPRYLGWKGPEGRRQLAVSCPCSTPLHPPTPTPQLSVGGRVYLKGMSAAGIKTTKSKSFAFLRGKTTREEISMQTSIPVFLGHIELGGKLGMHTQEAQMWSPLLQLHPSGLAPDTQSWR